MPPCAIVWFRNDLRLADNPALNAALENGYLPLCVYIHAPEEEGDWSPGAASEAWLHHSLVSLDLALRERGSRLIVMRGPSDVALKSLIRQSKAKAVYWNRKYEPATQPRDAGIKHDLHQLGIEATSFNGTLLFEPWSLSTKQGGAYKVFTPFWRNALSQWRLASCVDAPEEMPAVPVAIVERQVHELGLLPRPRWDRSFWETWQPGEAGAHEALEIFTDGALNAYRTDRDRPDRVGTSLLSPHLHFGEIAPWRIASVLEESRTARNAAEIDGYIRELGWREFSYHLMHHFPETISQNLNPRFRNFDWASANKNNLQAWQQGRTGVPIVDAGMRELWTTGYMHNRVRMIVASWLTKHMRVHWLSGARWFWDTLVDADLANNTLGWQWVAGTGADAAPYFRVFNPVTQARKFDPRAEYITRWVPELSALPLSARFAPWEQPDLAARVAPDYPRAPLVDLASGRDAALAAYRKTPSSGAR